MPIAHMLAFGKPSCSLVSGTRPGCHDMTASPAVGKLAISNVPHHHTCPNRARKTRPDLPGQT
eukprot:9484016-Alexandrium_andersonii.AAC.1